MSNTYTTETSVKFNLFPESKCILQDTHDMISMYCRGVRLSVGKGYNFGDWMHAIESNIHREPGILNQLGSYSLYVMYRNDMLYRAANYYKDKTNEYCSSQFKEFVNILKLSGKFDELKDVIKTPLEAFNISEDSPAELRPRHDDVSEDDLPN